MDELVLDPAIRNWVVLPMVLLLTMVGIGRSYVQQLIKSEQVMTEKEYNTIRHKQTLMRADRLRINGQFINGRSFATRKTYLYNKKATAKSEEVVAEGATSSAVKKVDDNDASNTKGLLQEKVPGMTNPMSMQNPTALIDMLKNNAVGMVPNFAMMSFVNYFFQGFVCLKIPFSMPSEHFKTMLQRGVDIGSLDVSYVSSLSWYILLTFGLSGVYRLILDEGMEVDQGQMMAMQMNMGGGAGFDASTAYKNSRQILSITKNDFDGIAQKVEQKLLGAKYPSFEEEDIDLSNFK